MRQFTTQLVLIFCILSVGFSQSKKADSLRRTGINFKNQGSFDSALILYQQAVIIYKKEANYSGVANCIRNMGSVYMRLAQYEKATENYYKSLCIYDSVDDKNGIGLAYINLGNYFHYHERNLDSAYSFLTKSKTIFIELGNTRRLRSVYNNLGNLFYETRYPNDFRNIDSAVTYYKIALRYYEEVGDSINLAGVLSNIGRVFEYENELDSASLFYAKSLNIRRSVNDRYGIAASLSNLGNINKKQGNNPRAKEYYLKTLSLAEELQSNIYISNALINLSEIEENQGNYKTALEDHKRLYEVNQTIYNEEKAAQIAELQTKYETEKKEKEIAQQKVQIREADTQKNQLLTSIVIIILSASIVLIIMLQRQRMMKIVSKKNERIHKQEVNQLLNTLEIKSLDSMIEGQEKERKRIAEELHDRLGNTLTAAQIYAESISENKGTSGSQMKKIKNLLDTAIKDTRQISHNMLSGVLTKFGLVAALKDLKDTVTGTDKIDMNFEIIQFDGRLETQKEINLYRIVQESVSNILKHANATLINISLRKTEQEISLEIQDNGIGFDIKNSNDGVGLRNIASRVNSIGGKWAINSLPNEGTTITINIAV